MQNWLWAGSALYLCVPSYALALPEGGMVSAGIAEIHHVDAHTVITQSTDRAVIDWQSFDVDAAQHVHFSQPSVNAAILNRIHDADASIINGTLTANGQVYLVNPNGMVFGKGARVNVGSLVATTADIFNAAFMSGGKIDFSIAGTPNAAILNQGYITAKEAGLVALVAPQVANSGIITAKAGTIALTAGDTMTLDMYGDALLSVAVSDSTYLMALNEGGLLASGGTISMTSATASHLLDNVVANSGVIEATAIGEKGGADYPLCGG